jgi:hypothetical protein
MENNEKFSERSPHRGTFNRQSLASAAAAKRFEWAKLDLRQDWVDAAYMRETLVRCGIKIVNNAEPATVKRIRQLARRAGVIGLNAGMLGYSQSGPLNEQDWLKRNPRMPLWAAVAHVLELSGR